MTKDTTPDPVEAVTGTKVCADCGDPGTVGDGLRIKRRGAGWVWVCLDDGECELRETVRDLRAYITAADALRMWADLGDECATAHAVEAYDAAREKVVYLDIPK